jgi:hypothetical protein
VFIKATLGRAKRFHEAHFYQLSMQIREHSTFSVAVTLLNAIIMKEAMQESRSQLSPPMPLLVPLACPCHYFLAPPMLTDDVFTLLGALWNSANTLNGKYLTEQ